MAEYASLNDAMDAFDEMAEAKMRYRLLADAFENEPKLRSQLSPAIERAKSEILRLRAVKPPKVTPTESGTVVPFDANRFRKSG